MVARCIGVGNCDDMKHTAFQLTSRNEIPYPFNDIKKSKKNSFCGFWIQRPNLSLKEYHMPWTRDFIGFIWCLIRSWDRGNGDGTPKPFCLSNYSGWHNENIIGTMTNSINTFRKTGLFNVTAMFFYLILLIWQTF